MKEEAAAAVGEAKIAATETAEKSSETKVAAVVSKATAGVLKDTGKVSGKLTEPVESAKEEATDIKEAAKESKQELKEAVKESKQATYSQDELDTISSMAARHAALSVEQALKHSNGEKHL